MICPDGSLAEVPDSNLQDLSNMFITDFTCSLLRITFLNGKSGTFCGLKRGWKSIVSFHNK